MGLFNWLFGNHGPPPGKERLEEIGDDSESEDLAYEIDPDWTLGHSAGNPVEGAIMEFIRQGDDINSWKELFTLFLFPLDLATRTNLGSSPEEMFDRLKTQKELCSPGLTSWHALEKDERSILYEWQAKPCRDALGVSWPAQHEIVRIIDGKLIRFRMSYTAKTYQMPSESRTKWIQTFSMARVRPLPVQPR